MIMTACVHGSVNIPSPDLTFMTQPAVSQQDNWTGKCLPPGSDHGDQDPQVSFPVCPSVFLYEILIDETEANCGDEYIKRQGRDITSVPC